MKFSIINILDDLLSAKDGVVVKIIIQNNGIDEIIFNGNSDFMGQIFFLHSYEGVVSVFVDGQFHSSLQIPCMKTIVINNKCKSFL